MLDTDAKDGHKAMLVPCMKSRLDLQSWIFRQGSTNPDPHDPAGDYIRLASDPRYYLRIDVIPLKDTEELEERHVLTVVVIALQASL